MDYQVIIIGGGPAAQNAALALGRSRKRVLVCDEGKPRNRVAKHSHTFFTRDGTPPLELRKIALEQLAPYDTVEFRLEKVSGVESIPGGYRVELESGDARSTQLVLLAVGMALEPPGISGFDELWGDTVIHCPYCHGWELRDRPWAIYLTEVDSFPSLAKLRSWTSDVTVIVKDGVTLPSDTIDRLAAIGYRFEAGTLTAFQSKDGKLSGIELEDGRVLPRDALLFSPPQKQTTLVKEMELELDEDGYVVTTESGETSLPGVYAAGDLTKGRQQIVVAAAEGMKAAIVIDGVLAAAGG